MLASCLSGVLRQEPVSCQSRILQSYKLVSLNSCKSILRADLPHKSTETDLVAFFGQHGIKWPAVQNLGEPRHRGHDIHNG